MIKPGVVVHTHFWCIAAAEKFWYCCCFTCRENVTVQMRGVKFLKDVDAFDWTFSVSMCQCSLLLLSHFLCKAMYCHTQYTTTTEQKYDPDYSRDRINWTPSHSYCRECVARSAAVSVKVSVKKSLSSYIFIHPLLERRHLAPCVTVNSNLQN